MQYYAPWALGLDQRIGNNWEIEAQRNALNSLFDNRLCQLYAKPPRPDLTPKQLDWCRKNIPAFNNRSELAEGPK